MKDQCNYPILLDGGVGNELSKEKSNRHSGIRQYFSLPRRKSKNGRPLEISSPINVSYFVEDHHTAKKTSSSKLQAKLSGSLNNVNAIFQEKSCVEKKKTPGRVTSPALLLESSTNYIQSPQGNIPFGIDMSAFSEINTSSSVLEKSRNRKETSDHSVLKSSSNYWVGQDVVDSSTLNAIHGVPHKSGLTFRSHASARCQRPRDLPPSGRYNESGVDRNKLDTRKVSYHYLESKNDDQPSSPNNLDYDIPRPLNFPTALVDTDYDVPKSLHSCNSKDTNTRNESSSPNNLDYDIPRPLNFPTALVDTDYDVPKSLHSCNSKDTNTRNESSSPNNLDYDIPRPLNFPTALVDTDYDVPKSLYSCNSKGTNTRNESSTNLEMQKPHQVFDNYVAPGCSWNYEEKNLKSPIYDSKDYDKSKFHIDSNDCDVPKCHRSDNDYTAHNSDMDCAVVMTKSNQIFDDQDARKSDIIDDCNYDIPRQLVTKASHALHSSFNKDISKQTLIEVALGRRSNRRDYTAELSSSHRFNNDNGAGNVDSVDQVDGCGKEDGDRTDSLSPLESISRPCVKPKRALNKSGHGTIMENCVARALYDNSAESPDELAFRRGDVLTVLEQNTGGLEGWWLCGLRGRQGICPGNRLRIVPGCYDTGTGVPTGGPAGAGGSLPHPARSTGAKVVTPKRIGDIYTYATPRRYPAPQQHLPQNIANAPAPPRGALDYDVPPSRMPQPVLGDSGRLTRSSSLRYDAPRLQQQQRSSLEQHDSPLPPDSFIHYDIPRPQQQHAAAQSALYDSPRPQMAQPVSPLPLGGRSLIKGVRGGGGGSPHAEGGADTEQYDVPRPLQEQMEVPVASDRSSGVSIMSCDSTSSSASSCPASESPYLSSIGGFSNRSSLEVQDSYDVPPEPRKVGSLHRPRLPPRENPTHSASSVETSSSAPVSVSTVTALKSPRTEGVYDVPPQVSRDGGASESAARHRVSSGSDCSCGGGTVAGDGGVGLPFEYDSAKDMLAKLQQDVQSSLEKLANFNVVVGPSDKSVTNERYEESKVVVDRLKRALHEFITFCKGSCVNASKLGNDKLANTLHKQLENVSATFSIISDTWSCAQTNRDEAMEVTQQLSNITNPLGNNVRQLTTLIHTNANLLFKKTPSIEQTKQKCSFEDETTCVQDKLYANEAAFLEDYDYVKLESRGNVDREHQHVKGTLPTNLRTSYDNLVKQGDYPVDNDHTNALLQPTTTRSSPTKATNSSTSNANHNLNDNQNKRLDANDRQVLAFYGNQAEQHIRHLNTAIDAFFLTIEGNQPPKVFIAHSKFVILGAHKLIFIGDTVHRHMKAGELRTSVLACSNALCDAMKNAVSSAKTAAIQFPSVAAVQAMVDSFAAVSQLASNLRNTICRL